MSSKQKLFLGVTLGRRTNWETYFAEPVATRSSKPDSVAKEIQRKREEREEQAHFLPVAATVSSCVLLDQDGNEVLTLASTGFGNVEGQISHQALTTIVQVLGDDLYADFSKDDIGISLFGLNIRDRIRIMALDAMRFISQNEGAEAIAPGLWYNRPFEVAPYLDPYDVVIPSELRKDVPWDGLYNFLGLEVPDTNPDTDARLQADIARQIALKANLF